LEKFWEIVIEEAALEQKLGGRKKEDHYFFVMYTNITLISYPTDVTL
jgi:predicted glycosyltransferase involved in capsule biosynthesis